jgi:hypothetical protein
MTNSMADALHGLAIYKNRQHLLSQIGMVNLNLASVGNMVGTSFLTNWSLRCVNCCGLAGLRGSSERIDLVAREHILEYCKQVELSSSFQL